MHQLRVLLVCSALLLAAATTLPNGKTVGGRVLKEGQELDSEQESALPDTSDPKKMKTLKCGVCQATVMEMAYAINARENDTGRKLREVEIVEVLDKICTHNMDKYGLMLDDQGQPTERWSNDDKSMRAKGGWVTRLATGTCADVYSEHEEYLVEMAPKLCTVDYDKGKKTCSTKELVLEICAKSFKWCSIADEPKSKEPEL